MIDYDPKTAMVYGATCKRCGKVMGGDGDRPAEIYLGTFTGLCYDCEKRGAQRIDAEFDGAEHWEHAPHCPSWRRDRERYIGYPGCVDCKGRGRIMVSRPFPQGGPYAIQCKACSTRYYGQPWRAKWSKRKSVLLRVAHDVFRAHCKKIARRKKVRASDCDGMNAIADAERPAMVARYERALALLERLQAKTKLMLEPA